MTIKFHISDDLLLSYSAGTLDEASSLLVATHLALCPHCRTRNASADAVGGYLLETLQESSLPAGMMGSVLARVRTETDAPTPAHPAPDLRSDLLAPEPLRSYLGGDLHELNWARLAPRVHQVRINTHDRRAQVRLLRFQCGMIVPAHGHNGRELTLVLEGSLCDGDAIFQRGDIAETDDQTEHQPRAGQGQDCICLVVTDAPLRFKGVFARMLQPFFGI